MTVNKLGRPSKAGVRRREILEAMRRVAGHQGLAGVTVTNVAEAAGVQRTLVFHYFGDRQSLIGAFIEHAVGAYGEQQVLGGQGDIAVRVDRAFAPGFYETDEDLAIWQELIALAARDPGVRTRLRSLWLDRWLPQIESDLRTARPSASAKQISQVAYALAGLVEAHWAFRAQGVGEPRRVRQAQAAARGLLATLPGTEMERPSD
jgi:AcrR family transcriptional regulator